MKYIFVLFLFISTLFAQQKLLEPNSFYTIPQGLATDIVYANKKLYIASDSGKVDVFSTKSQKQLQEVTLSKIKDFMGDEIDSKIFSIDLVDGALLILSQDNGGYSRVHIYKNNKLTLIISGDEHLNITKAKFINKHTILLALISGAILYQGKMGGALTFEHGAHVKIAQDLGKQVKVMKEELSMCEDDDEDEDEE